MKNIIIILVFILLGMSLLSLFVDINYKVFFALSIVTTAIIFIFSVFGSGNSEK